MHRIARNMNALVLACICACVCVEDERARAQTTADDERPSAELVYTRDPGAANCPDELELRDAVAARLGYVPFRTPAALRVETHIESNRAGLRASVDVWDAHGVLVGQRTIRSRTQDCEELARGVALAISVAIDPMSLMTAAASSGAPTSPTSPAVPDGQPVASPPASPPADPEPLSSDQGAQDALPPEATSTDGQLAPASRGEPPVASERTSPSELALGTELVLAYGAVPGLRPGLALRLLYRRGRFGLDVLAGWLASGSADANVGRVYAQLGEARALGCYSVRPFVACGGPFVAFIAGRGEGVASPGRDQAWLAGLGVEAGVEFALGSRLRLSARGALDVPFVRAALELDGREAWRSSAVSPRVYLGGSVRLR